MPFLCMHEGCSHEKRCNQNSILSCHEANLCSFQPPHPAIGMNGKTGVMKGPAGHLILFAQFGYLRQRILPGWPGIQHELSGFGHRHILEATTPVLVLPIHVHLA